MSDSTVDRVRVLIVEDEALVADDLRSRLQRMGYEPVGIVDRAEHVVAAATELRPHLVLLDIKLKGSGDGVDAAQQLRARTLPFVFVTSHADKATLERACRTEPFGYLVKPFEDREVDAAVRMAMSRHRAETQLRSMGNWLSTVLRSIGDAVVVTDEQQRVTFLNEAGEQLTRWPAGQALGEPFTTVLPLVGADGRPIADPVAASMHRGSSVYLEDGARLVRRDGQQVPVEDSAAPVRGDGDTITGAVVVLRDCTDKVLAQEQQRRAEAQLREAQRLESLGTLAGGLAHDFNNILTAILGNVSFARSEVPADAALQQQLAAIESSALAASELCKRMRSCSTIGQLHTESIDFNRVVAAAVEMVRIALVPGARVRLQFETGLPALLADPLQVQQVVINLLTNASEALPPEGGDITVSTGRCAPDAAPVGDVVAAPTAEREQLWLEVADTGTGMTRAVQARVFEPFFSTKFDGRGLGLPGVLGIVRSHGGGMQLATAPGAGTRFRVTWPVPLPTAAATSVGAVSGAASAFGGGTILVVDDDAQVREVLRRQLAGWGFEVVEGASGAAALELGELHRGRIVLALVDVVMPGMDGVEVVAQLRRRWPQLPVVLTSGTASMPTAAQRLLQVAYLPKPFSRPQLLAKLIQLLPGRPLR